MKPLKLAIYTCFCLLVACNNSNNTSKDKSVISLDQQKDCISYILKQDDSLGNVRNHNCEKISLSITIEQYVNSVNKLNFDNCTPEFEQAFKNHMMAWTKMKKVTDNYPNLRGEMHDLFDSIEKTQDSSEFKPLLESIWDTWAEVETAIPTYN